MYETVTFYTMLNLKQVGKFHIQVCKSLMCALVGSDTVDRLDQSRNSASDLARRRPTASLRLATVECLAACGTGPMMQINEDYYERLTEEKFDRILADLRSTGSCSLEDRSVYVAGTACSER